MGVVPVCLDSLPKGGSSHKLGRVSVQLISPRGGGSEGSEGNSPIYLSIGGW